MNELPEFEGFWWAPEDLETQLAGRLIADDDVEKLILTINNPRNIMLSRQEPRHYEVLHGKTIDGKLITLLKCFEINKRWSSNGVETIVILANYVLVGGLVPQNKLENAFSGMSLKWPGLLRWFFDSGVSVQYDESDPRSFTIVYSPPNSFEFLYAKNLRIKFEFRADRLPIGGPLNETIEFKEIVWVVLKKDKPASFDFFLEKLNELIQFFSICTLEYNQPEEVTLIGDFDIEKIADNRQISPRLKVCFSSGQEPQSDRLSNPVEYLMPYSVIKDNFSNLLKSWAAIATDISPSRSLYFSSLYGTNKYIHSNFLSLAQAAEVFHRRRYDGTYIPEKDYKKDVLPVLKSAIPSELDIQVRQTYEQRLMFFNEFSLAKRLKNMASNHEDVFREYVPDWKEKVRSVVNARNYYTHYTEGREGDAPDINTLFECRKFLKMLLELEMMAEAGVDKSLLHNQAKKCQRYR